MLLEVDIAKQLGAFSFAAGFAIDGTRIGIFGRSGSGKSTLANLMTGSLRPDSGTIRLDRRLLYDHRSKTNLRPEQRRIAVVFQQAHLFPHLSVEGNLLYGLRRNPAATGTMDPKEVAEALGIEQLLKRNVGALSGGEKQRVALGRALLYNPDLLIMDEPLSALDQTLKDQIIPFLRKTLRRFATPYLYISHSLREMRLLTDQVLVFTHGQLVQTSAAEALARARLQDKHAGYQNHLTLTEPREVGSLTGFRWGNNELLLAPGAGTHAGVFELDAEDILLLNTPPTAVSARNLLTGVVVELIPQGGMVVIRLECNREELLARVVREAAVELGLTPGRVVHLAVKATAFRRLL